MLNFFFFCLNAHSDIAGFREDLLNKREMKKATKRNFHNRSEEVASKDDSKADDVAVIQTHAQPICSKVQAFGDIQIAQGKI